MFLHEDYEAICAAIAMIDSAHTILDESQICDDEVSELHQLQNELNSKRLTLLGNGQDRPYHVSELNPNQGDPQ